MAVTMPPAMPVATPETAPFWEAVEEGKLRLSSCPVCAKAFFPPSNICPRCGGRDIEWVAASGRATLYSYVIAARPLAEWQCEGPMSVAHVVLEEGPALVSTIVGCAQTPSALRLDMPLRAVFRPFGRAGGETRNMLCFEPTSTAFRPDSEGKEV